MLSKFRRIIWLDSREEVRVVTDFSQLDQNVLVVTHRGPFLDGGFLE